MRCGWLLVCAAAASAGPSIVYVVTDDQDQMLGSSFPERVSGTPMPKTKALLVEKGVTFTNMFIHVPICNPSRSSTLTGRYFHNLKTTNTSWGAMHVNMDLVHNSSFAISLRAAGYETGLFGKYCNAMPSYAPEGWDAFMGNGGGNYMNPSFDEYGSVPARESWDADGANYTTSVVGNASIAWIRTASGPFFAYIAPKAAHEPFNPAPWYVDYWDEAWPSTETTGPAWNASVEVRATHAANVPSQPMLTSYSSEVIAGVWRNRWRTLLSVDDLISAVDAELDDDAYVFFSSDHGFQLGQFNMLMDKRHVYDWDTRIHLVVKGPGLRPRLEPRPATNVDLAPTFLDLARAAPLTPFDGRSLAGLLFEDNLADWRQSVFIEYYYNDPNDKCLSNCTEQTAYPEADASCADLIANALCWGGCTDDCYPTEDLRNNFIALRVLNASRDLLYAKYENGSQTLANLTFLPEESRQEGGSCCFHELFDAAADPWMLDNLYDAAAPPLDLDRDLMAWFACSGDACP